MQANYFLKSPGAVLDYTLDWESRYLGDGESLSEDLGWSVFPDDAAAGGLRLDATGFDAGATTVRVAGGRNGATYQLRNRIRTSAGRTDERVVVLRIAPR